LVLRAGKNPYVESDGLKSSAWTWSNAMTKTWTRGFWFLTVAVLITVGALFASRPVPASTPADDAKVTSGAHYTVVETEGHNLVVTDNGSNTLYFYTVDKGKPPGSELKLRAKVDLNQVGKPTIMPSDVNIQK
jgi:hypothetical protein